MKIRTVFIILITQLFCLNLIDAQTTPNIQQENSLDETSEWQIPPLQTLIDSAMIHSSAKRMSDIAVIMGEYGLEEVQRRWIRYVNMSGNARWGNSYDLSRIMSFDEMVDDSPRSSSSLSYGAGVSVYLPLAEILDRKRPLKMAKLTIEQSKIQQGEVEKQIRQMVISSYYDLLSLRKEFEVQTEMYSSTTMYYEQVKQDYEANKVTLDEYTRAYTSYLQAQAGYESQKNNFIKAIRMMEELVGFKILQ